LYQLNIAVFWDDAVWSDEVYFHPRCTLIRKALTPGYTVSYPPPKKQQSSQIQTCRTKGEHDRSCTYTSNTEVLSRNHSCCEKGKGMAHSGCVSVALAIQHLMRMRSIILSSVACPALSYYSTLSHKRQDFRGKNLLNIKCVF